MEDQNPSEPLPPPRDPPLTPAELAIRRAAVEAALQSDDFRRSVLATVLHLRHGTPLDTVMEEAQDVRQEVAARALTNAGRFDPAQSQPVAWLMGITINVLRERRRLRARDDARRVLWTPEQWAAVVARLADNHQANADELSSRVAQVLECANPDQRRLLRLYFLETREYREIAFTLGIAEAAARQRVHRALQALRDQIQP